MEENTLFQLVQPEGIYRPATYHHGARVGETIYVAGQVARDAQGALVAPHDAAGQARQVYANLGAVLAAAGSDFAHIVKITTYLVDAADGPAVTAVRQEHLGGHRPPHTGVIVAALGDPAVRVEVEVVAVVARRA